MQEPLCEKGFLQHYTPTPTLMRIRMGVVFFCNGKFTIAHPMYLWGNTDQRKITGTIDYALW